MPSELALTSRSRLTQFGRQIGPRHSPSSSRRNARPAPRPRLRVRLTTAMRSKPARDQGIDDRPGRAAGADDDRQSPLLRPARGAFVHIGQKAGDVGVVAPQAPVLPPQRVHRPERLRDRRSPVAGAERRFLVGHGHIGADEVRPGRSGRRTRRILPADGEPFVSFPAGRAASANSDGSSASASGRPASRRRPREAKPVSLIARSGLRAAARQEAPASAVREQRNDRLRCARRGGRRDPRPDSRRQIASTPARAFEIARNRGRIERPHA